MTRIIIKIHHLEQELPSITFVGSLPLVKLVQGE